MLPRCSYGAGRGGRPCHGLTRGSRGPATAHQLHRRPILVVWLRQGTGEGLPVQARPLARALSSC